MCFDVFVVEGGYLPADVRCCRDGRAPIHSASLMGHLSCLEFLVDHKADVNLKTK
jgi:hypothetical protein